MAANIEGKQTGAPAEEPDSSSAQQGRFLREFIRKPASTGAIVPSSVELARLMAEEASLEGASVIVEFGPGTGPITRALIESKPENAKLIAIERNEEFVAMLRERHPDLDVAHDCVQELPSILAARGETAADRIVSGLPWAAFDESLQRDIMKAAHDSLAEDGVFVTFAYLQGFALPPAWRFRKLLRGMFSEVRQSEVVWRNVPPAFVYTCRK
ncbi:MAG: SAM-dependent methyltransferase [Acidobacteria bacterium]|nr:SAM-dependent methyltransferase [Acidobacteriota bacterium]